MKLKNLIQKYLLNNIGYKILAVIFAFIIWLAIMNVQDPTVTKTISGIPVSIQNEELITAENVYTVKSGENASITISGRRSVVNGLSASDFEAAANFEELSITNAVPVTVSLVEQNAYLQNQIEITQKTTMMVINFENIESRTMGVQVEFSGTEPKDKIIESSKPSPSFVKVTAPTTIFEKIDKAEAIIDYSDLNGSGTYKSDIVLVDAKGAKIPVEGDVTVDATEISVELEMSYTKEIPIRFEVQGTPAEGHTLTEVVLSYSTVKVKGEKSAIEAISEIALPSSLMDISGEDRNVSITVNIADYLPSGISLAGENTTLVIMAQIV